MRAILFLYVARIWFPGWHRCVNGKFNFSASLNRTLMAVVADLHRDARLTHGVVVPQRSSLLELVSMFALLPLAYIVHRHFPFPILPYSSSSHHSSSPKGSTGVWSVAGLVFFFHFFSIFFPFFFLRIFVCRVCAVSMPRACAKY